MNKMISFFPLCPPPPKKKNPINVPVPQIHHPSDAIQFMDQTVDYLIPANLFFRSPLYYKRVIYKIRLS